MTLPPSFSHFTSAWESTPTNDQTMVNLTSRLLIEEARLEAQNATELHDALVARRCQQSRNKTSGRNGNCNSCGEKGHFKNQCPHRRNLESSSGGNGNSFELSRGESSEYWHRRGDALASVNRKHKQCVEPLVNNERRDQQGSFNIRRAEAYASIAEPTRSESSEQSSSKVNFNRQRKNYRGSFNIQHCYGC